MTTIYLVTSGSYSDYCIRAIFSTREAAEAYIADYNHGAGWPEIGVEEWPLDAPREELYGAYVATIDERGALVDKITYSMYYRPNDPVTVRTGYSDGCAWVQARAFQGHGLTPEHARRSAEEYRRAVLTSNIVSEEAP